MNKRVKVYFFLYYNYKIQTKSQFFFISCQNHLPYISEMFTELETMFFTVAVPVPNASDICLYINSQTQPLILVSISCPDLWSVSKNDFWSQANIYDVCVPGKYSD